MCCLDLYLGSLNLSLGFYRDQGSPSGWDGGGGRVPTLSVCSVWSPGYGGKVGGQDGAEDLIPKSTPLGQKAGMSHREKKGNTFSTSTHFPCFLQNQSNCKTVL